MANNSQNQRSFLRRHITAMFIATIIVISGFTPFLYQNIVVTDVNTHITDPIGTYTTTPINQNVVAGEPNFTRVNWPFVLNNYPNFTWRNPGNFNGSQDAAGNILVLPNGPSMGYDRRITPVGTGKEAYPAIYNSLSGLNESNIRIMYLDADYNWISAPYEIDQKGWANIWYPGDLNKWGGLDAGGGTNLFSNGGGEHVAADMTVGVGWIAGDLVNSEGVGAYGGYPGGLGANNMLLEWYRIPTWTYVTPRQPDGSVSNENVDIDPEYAANLVWVYMQNKTNRPHTAWLGGDTGGGSAVTNDWNANTGAPGNAAVFRNTYPMYHNITRNSRRPAFVNTTTWADPWIMNTTGANNVVFMGDTWFRTPSNAASNPAWLRTAYPYQQINGAVDKDDEICFYVYPGRRSPNYLWWNYSYFPQRFELKIVDPVDGGWTYMYIYYNNATAYNPLLGGINLGAPKYTTKDDNGNPISDYVSWDPDTQTITSDFYRTSVNPTNPSLMNNLQLFGNTDGQTILASFNKMYLYGYILLSQGGQTWSTTWAFGREGVWYDWAAGTANSFSELVCILDNPCVKYPQITTDCSITRPYGTVGDTTADRRGLALAPQCPQNYYGPQGIARGHTPAYSAWEATYGDGRAMIDGPCRVIFYLQQYLITGLHPTLSVSGTTVVDDYVDLVIPIMDGPQFYYSHMQLGAPASVEIPSISGFTIQVYYVYVECGNINPALRNDFNVTAVREYTGGTDGIDQHQPKFTFANGYGYTKIGGTDPKTSSYTVLGYSNFNTSRSGTNYYGSQGNPLLNVAPDANVVCPPDGNNLNLPDWAMVTSATHGGVWLYIPKREASEVKDNNGLKALNAQPKMYFRDDAYQAEFGICLDGGASPWIQGGASTSEYKLMMVFGEFKQTEALATGHKLYCDYFFPLEGQASFSSSVAPGPRFVFGSATPDKLVYKTGEKVNIIVTGSPKNATLYVNGRNIHNTDPTMATMTNRGDGTWNYTYNIDVVSSYAAPAVTKYINLTGSVAGLGPLWVGAASTYLLNITIDNTAPSPTAQLAALPYSTSESSVYLSWAAIPGFDQGCASMANPSGLGWYKLVKWNVSEVADGVVLADHIPITTTSFLDTFVQNGIKYNYRITTYDELGNNASSTVVSTLISLPFTPGQPATLAPTQKTGSGIVIDWSANPGYPSAPITGYRVYRCTSINGVYNDVSGLLGAAVRTYTNPAPFVEATTYYFKLMTVTAAKSLYSAPVFTRIDNVAPAPAELATPLPTYRSQEAEIIVSWAVETLPEYQTGGFPGQDLNGIAYWQVHRKVGAGTAFPVIATIPYGELTEDQQFHDTNVVNGTTYTYGIWTYDGAGNFAKNTVNKTTKLWVVGPGKAEPYTVTPGSGSVKHGQTNIPVTVLVKNPGNSAVTLNQVQLCFWWYNITKWVNVTKDYAGVRLTDGTALNQYTNRTFTFYVNVSATANLGDIIVDAQTLYDSNKKILGATNPGSWVVTPDASLLVDTVTSTKSIVHPGDKDIPVTVKVDNPGLSGARIETVQLTFKQGTLDISDKFLVETISTLPTTYFSSSSRSLSFNITVGQSVTSGGVVINAFVTGSTSGIPLADTDGAATTLTWAIQTTAKPVIASVVADQAVYWTGGQIRLTVTCDKAGHTVRGNFQPLDGSAANDTAVDNGGGLYTITHNLGTAAGENTYTATVYATNASGAVKQTIGIRLGNAPTFSGWVQNPVDGNVEYFSIVDIDIEITDNSGAQYVQASLKYRFEGGDWNIRPMTHTSGTHWDVTIPATGLGGSVEYYINATDNAGNWALYSKSYTVKTPPVTPIWVSGSQKACNPSNPNVIYNETNPAPRGTPIAYKANIDTQFMTNSTGTYTVVVSAFDPIHHAWVSINSSVQLTKPSAPVAVSLLLTFKTADVPAGTLITGQIYICTGLPENGGRTLVWVSFSHLVS